MRILIVEDEVRLAEAIKRSLQAAQFAADAVHDGPSGLAAAQDADYDLVILDRLLPGGIDGLAICQQLRASGVTTPVLMLTALGEVDDRVSGLQAGADDYIVKPFAMRELLARVQVLLRRPNVLAGPLLKVGDLVLNPETYEVRRAGHTIRLSSREYKLLAYMMYNPGQTLTKERLIAHVWDGDSLILPNTVEVYIGYLRRKIDRAFPDLPSLIHTVHGFGYRVGESS